MAEITQWEYKTMETGCEDNNIEKKLEQFGIEGWEQSGQITDYKGGTDRLIFKRPKTQNNAYGYSR